jgi:hypothetical protein
MGAEILKGDGPETAKLIANLQVIADATRRKKPSKSKKSANFIEK